MNPSAKAPVGMFFDLDSKAVSALGWIPLLVLPAASLAFRSRVAPWCFMWALSIAIFFGCKWQAWWEQRSIARGSIGPSLGFLFAWPGMDAATFLDPGKRAGRIEPKEWFWALGKTVCGAALLWSAVRRAHTGNGMLAGWVGMVGIILILHFGTFHILSLFWRSAGVDAPPIMQAPLSAASLADFWGRRWNLGFRHLTHRLVFEPARARFGAPAAILLAFFASGVIHDLVISLPARGGYGLPTGYFILQGLGVLLERSRAGRRLHLHAGISGWLFAATCAAGPAFLLFHPWFVGRVILPFLDVLGAR